MFVPIGHLTTYDHILLQIPGLDIDIMVFFEGQHFSFFKVNVFLLSLSFGGCMFGVYSSMGKKLGSSDNAGNFESCRRSNMNELFCSEKTEPEEWRNSVTANSLHCSVNNNYNNNLYCFTPFLTISITFFKEFRSVKRGKKSYTLPFKGV